MDELELLKKDWNKSDSNFKSYSETDIYPMLHKKSSSIVKTLFYISIAEFCFWILVNVFPFFLSDTYRTKFEKNYEHSLFWGLTLVTTIVILVFMYLLFKSYKSVSITDSAKKLMESILKIRKIIKYYVLYNLALIFITVPVSFYIEYVDNPGFREQIDSFDSNQTLVMGVFVVLFLAAFVGFMWLFYRLLYGILLKRLNRNYEELKKLEV